MSSSETAESSLIESLDNIDQYLARLQQLPTPSEFAETVEDDLWRVVTEQSNPSDEVQYTDLPDTAHSLIGRYETDDGSADPWWLKEFIWCASFGNEEIQLQGDNLDLITDTFDRDRTLIKKPELRDSYHVRGALEAFDAIENKLGSRVIPASDISFPNLPDSLFIMKEGLLKPTDEFGEWIDQFLSLAPGIGPEATALYLAHTGTSEEAAQSVLDQELFENVADPVDFEDTSYGSGMMTDFKKVLRMSMAFNRVIPVDDAYDGLSGLQYQLYKGYLETNDPRDEFVQQMIDSAIRKVPEKIDRGEQGLFTRVACGTPLLLYDDRRPKLMSIAMYSPKSNSSGYSDGSYTDVKKLFEEYGWFDNE